MTKSKVICPLMGGLECVEDGSIRNGELVSCKFWITIQGKHPQTGETINNADCSMAWLPILMIENSKINRETGAAIESMRNESVTTGQQLTNAVLLASNNKQELLYNKL